MMSVYLRVFSLLLLLFSISLSETTSVKLSKFIGKEVIELRGMRALYTIDIPINPVWKVKKLTLFLYLKSSPALKPERSEISILLNKKLLTSRRLGGQGIITVDVKDPELMDFNLLELRASQHYCINCCEYEDSPELWTYIDAERSYIVFEYTPGPFPKNIAFLKDIFLSPRLISPVELDFVMESTSPGILKPAVLLAGFLGAHVKYRDIHIEYSRSLRGKHTFIIGTHSFVREVMKDYEPVGNIQIFRNPLDSSKFVLVLSGDSDREILNAVLGFISIPSAYLAESSVFVSEVSVPEFSAYESSKLLLPGEKVSMKRLIGGDTNIDVYGGKLDIPFFIPPDLYLSYKDKLKVKLFYNHGLLVREDSTVNIYVNGKFTHSIPIDPKDEKDIKVTEIKIPMSVLKKGFNTLTIESALVPYKKDFCSIANYKNTKVIIYGNSYVEMPDTVHWTEMPYIEYFTSTGYPFTLYPDMRDTAIVLESSDKYTLSSLFTIFAFIGTRIHIPPFAVEVSTHMSQDLSDKNLIFFWKENRRVIGSVTGSSDSIISIRKFLLDEKKKPALAKLRAKHTHFTMAMRESPFESGKTMLVLNSQDSKALYGLIKNLYKPDKLSKIAGDTVLYDDESGNIYAFSSGSKYYVGNMPIYKEIYYRIGHDLKYIALIVLISIILLTISAKQLLNYMAKRRKQRHEEEEK